MKNKKEEQVSVIQGLLQLGVFIAPDGFKEEKSVKISFDKSQDQFTVRIPKGMAKELKIDNKKDKFKFVFEIKDGKQSLTGELERG